MLAELVLLLVISLVILFLSGDRVVERGKKLALYLGVSSFTFGLLVVAIGTSLPEIVVSLFSVLQGYPEIVVGDVLGSNIADLLLLVGIYSLLATWRIDDEFSALLAATASFAGIVFVYTLLRGTLTLIDGLILIAFFLLFVRTRLPLIEMEEKAEINLGEDVAVFLLSLIALGVSAYTAVNAIVGIAHILNVSPFIVAVLTLAIGTSLPELAVGLNAIKRGEPHLALGDAIGSLVVNSTLGFGIPALLLPVPVLLWEERFTIFMLLLGIFLFIYVVSRHRRLTRRTGAILLLLYLVFLAGILSSI